LFCFFLISIALAHNSQNSINIVKILTILSENSQNEKCINALGDILSHFIKNDRFRRIFENSGKTPFDMGDYFSCGEPDNQEYYMTLFGKINGLLVLCMGLCLPNECDSKMITKSLPEFSKYLSRVIGSDIDFKNIVIRQPKIIFEELKNNIPMGGKVFFIACFIWILISIIAGILDKNEIYIRKSKSIYAKILLSLSIFNNTDIIMKYKINAGDSKLRVLCGIQVIAIAWIILRDGFIFMEYTPTINYEKLQEVLIVSGFVAVLKAGVLGIDMFLLVSGIISTIEIYRITKNLNENDNKLTLILKCYLEHYLRFLPFLVFIIIYQIYVLPAIIESPLSANEINFDSIQCKEQWYNVLFFINNFTSNYSSMCAPWTYYIFIEMQLYLLLPFIVFSYIKNVKNTVILITILSLFSMFLLMWLAIYEEFDMTHKKSENNDLNTMALSKPYCRLIPYFLGVLLAFIYEDSNQNQTRSAEIKKIIKEKPMARYLFYLAGSLLIYITVYSFYFIDAYNYPRIFGIFHIVTVRPFFIIGICAILFPVILGNNIIVQKIFGARFLQPLAKISYGAYMMQIPLMHYNFFSRVQNKFFEILEAYSLSAMMFFLSHLVALILTILFESPIRQIVKNFIIDVEIKTVRIIDKRK